MKYLCLIFFLLIAGSAFSQFPSTRFEESNGKETPAYPEIIKWYMDLAKASPQVELKEMGPTDAGFPLHLALVSTDGKFDPERWHKQGKVVILVNNGIHPGEPDGIDASMLLLRDIFKKKITLPDNIALAVIPVYNIGGCLNRSTDYRVDQNGPEAFGFRGNSENLDLNRDFIKSDSREARSFASIFHFLNPDIFIDNHVSDGADYQHVLTLLSTQHNKLGRILGEYLNQTLEPAIYALMKEKGYDLVPYVNAFGDTPESGWPEFFDGPRYSSGYAALWHCIGFMPETHMLKPFEQRVKATYSLMRSFMEFATLHSKEILSVREKAIRESIQQKSFPVSWKLDRSKPVQINFKGYQAGKKTSEVSGLPRLYYDRNQPFEKKVNFFNQYNEELVIQKPAAYIIPQGWWKIIELLRLNQVKMHAITQDSVVRVEVYHIEGYQPLPRPFEMHHPNGQVKVSSTFQEMKFRKGDWLIPMDQVANRFLMEVLEPQAGDSYFVWNFFDAILGQKEGFSSYVFEETAAGYLKDHPELRTSLEEKKKTDSVFAKSGYAQLNFIFENSPYFEPDYLRYPVYRIPASH